MALLGAGPNSVVVSAQAPMPFDLSKGRVCAWILPRSCLLHLEPPAEAGKTAEVRSLQACRGSMTGAGFAPASLAWTSCVPPATPSWRASEGAVWWVVTALVLSWPSFGPFRSSGRGSGARHDFPAVSSPGSGSVTSTPPCVRPDGT